MNVLHICKDSEFGGIQKVAFTFSQQLSNEYIGYLLFFRKGNLFNYFPKTNNIIEIYSNNFFIKIFIYIKVIKELNIDVIHNHSGGLFWDLLNVILFNSKTLISHNHGCRINNYIFNEENSIIRLIKKIMARLVNQFLIKISVSENVYDLQKKFEKTSDRNHYLLYNPIDIVTLNKFLRNKENNSEKFVVGYIAKINESKGINKFLQVIKEIYSLDTEIKFFIAGKGELEASVKKFIEDNKCFFKLEYHNDFIKICEAFQKIDILLYPSKFESFGMTITEALYFGVPVIVSDQYKLNRIIDPLVTKVNFENIEDVIQKIFYLKKNMFIEKSKLFNKQIEFENNFSLNIVFDNLLNIYKTKNIWSK